MRGMNEEMRGVREWIEMHSGGLNGLNECLGGVEKRGIVGGVGF